MFKSLASSMPVLLGLYSILKDLIIFLSLSLFENIFLRALNVFTIFVHLVYLLILILMCSHTLILFHLEQFILSNVSTNLKLFNLICPFIDNFKFVPYFLSTLTTRAQNKALIALEFKDVFFFSNLLYWLKGFGISSPTLF